MEWSYEFEGPFQVRDARNRGIALQFEQTLEVGPGCVVQHDDLVLDGRVVVLGESLGESLGRHVPPLYCISGVISRRSTIVLYL
jgi:hypothetical protein